MGEAAISRSVKYIENLLFQHENNIKYMDISMEITSPISNSLAATCHALKDSRLSRYEFLKVGITKISF